MRYLGTSGNTESATTRHVPKDVQLHDLRCSPSIAGATKLRNTSWAGHVARTAERRGAYKDLVGDT